MTEPKDAPGVPFDVDGVVDAEKLRELLAVGAEHDVLDYKRTLDLSKGRKDRVVFAKHVAALSSLPRGGYIVVGVHEDGTPAHDQAPIVAEHFDSATLKQITDSYMDGATRIVSAVHNVENREIAVVFVAPTSDDLPPVMKCDGSYLLSSGTRDTVFRRGDVYVRDGTSSRGLRHSDWGTLLHRDRRRARESATAETRGLIAELARELRQPDVAGQQRVIIDLNVALADFEEQVDAALELGKDRQVRRTLGALIRTATRWDVPESQEKVHDALDRLAVVMAVAALHPDQRQFEAAVAATYRVYQSALTSPAALYAPAGQQLAAATLWREIAARLLGVLALIVRERAWQLVRPLVLRPVGDERHGYRSWFRHALTEASRAGVLVGTSGNPMAGAMIRFAAGDARRIPALCQGIVWEGQVDVEDTPQELDELLDSLCQADFLWCTVALSERLDRGTNEFYPSCSAFFSRRTSPILDLLAIDDRLRETVFTEPQVGARSMWEVAHAAQRVAAQQGMWHWDADSPNLVGFWSRNGLAEP